MLLSDCRPVVAGVWCLLILLVSASGCAGPNGDVPNETATDRALAAEEEYIETRLESATCVDGWGFEDYGGHGETATALNRSDGGVYVVVRHPFWYLTAELEADVGTEATYLVTADGARRVGGTEVSPCRERSAGAAAGPGVPISEA